MLLRVTSAGTSPGTVARNESANVSFATTTNNAQQKKDTVMQTQWMLASLAAVALGLAAFNVTGCTKSAPSESGAQAHQYTCSMHPEVVKDAPGDCPKCGMKLVEKH